MLAEFCFHSIPKYYHIAISTILFTIKIVKSPNSFGGNVGKEVSTGFCHIFLFYVSTYLLITYHGSARPWEYNSK